MVTETMSDSTELSCLRDLSRILRRERDTLGLFLEMVTAADADLDHCHDLLKSLAGIELHRAITAREAAIELGLGVDATLRLLAATAPTPWPIVLGAHRGALVALAAAVEETATAEVIDLREPSPRREFRVPLSLAEFLV